MYGFVVINLCEFILVILCICILNDNNGVNLRII